MTQPTGLGIESPIRWAGSKRSLLPLLRRSMPGHYGRYIEAFAGSACLYFAEAPQRALLADFNGELIRTYRSIQKGVELVISALEKLGRDRENYYAIRSMQPEPGSPAEAARFLYLNRFGFNGVYRTNRAGEFNVPRGTRTGKLPSPEQLRLVASHLSGARLSHQDFARTIGTARLGDFLYVDPPYVTTARSTYGEYGYGSFQTNEDLRRLKNALMKADARGVKIMFSFGSKEQFEELLTCWHVQDVLGTRKISAKLETRRTLYSEILATNYAVSRDG